MKSKKLPKLEKIQRLKETTKYKKQKIKTNKGITILALAITIIILLILAGITITLLTGENGLIKNAGQAKQETEIANEKEILERATARSNGTRFKRNCKRRKFTK